MLIHKDWCAWIAVDGKEIAQYQTTVEEVPSVRKCPPHATHIMTKLSCWIASEEGKEFVIHLANRRSSPPVSVHVYFDGLEAEGRLWKPRKDDFKLTGRALGDGSVEAPFLFSHLSLIDDDESAFGDISHLQKLGTIRVDLRRVQEQHIPIPTDTRSHSYPTNTRSVTDLGPIHETTKKSGAHCVTYGKERPIQAKGRHSVRYLDEKPFLSFCFQYRSADLLRAAGIISPALLAESPDLDTAHRPPKRQREDLTIHLSDSHCEVHLDRGGKEHFYQGEQALGEQSRTSEEMFGNYNNGLPSEPPHKKAKVEPLDISSFTDD